MLPELRNTDGGLCPAFTCSTGTTQYCGDIGDSCGQPQHCGACPTGQQCENNVCVAAGTVCLTGCTVAGGTYCGVIGDGCGGTLDCGTACPLTGWTCGTDHICKGGPTVCQADTCVAASGDQYCGTIGDGCGNTLDCGNPCPTGWNCLNNLCVGPAGVCNALKCATDSGDHYCGDIGDGCGGILACGDDCPAGWTCEDHMCKATPPACTLATCATASGDHYCGPIGDGCGGTLDCGADCPVGWNCVNSVCVGGPLVCQPATCDTAGGGRYCGQVGDGCGGTLNCPADCLQSGWICQDNLCIGPPSVCTKITCATASGDNYCGTVGDNCGGSLDCGTICPKAGWTCGTDNICKGPPGVCIPLSCTTSGGDHYCGTVGDGCGGTLDCGTTCPTAGWTCGTDNICKGGPTCVPTTCDAPNGDHYCGTIGDGCGGTLDCGTTCPKAGWTCSDNMCKADLTSCTPLTCVASSGDTYCGAIGDGCGGTLDCGTTCPKAGWVCENGLCKAGSTANCIARTCTTAYGDQYCGTIGDGCGNSVECGTTCAKAGWACQDNLCKAGPTANCVPLACTTANNDQYCGDIGDGCGGTVHCGTACTKAGWTCQDNLCKGGPTSGCTPLTCQTASGDQYCGDIGDGCGNLLDCGTTCAKSGWTCQNSLCKGGPTCTPVTCNPASGGRYCGVIGDGCGNSLTCSTDCSAAGSAWICQDNLCKGGPTCTPLTCAATSVDNYCGNIGDGCGGTLSCSATCPKTGWVCNQGLCQAGPTAACVPQACTTTAGDQYCGDIGDGCGSTAHCGTTCAKPGWTCQNNLCKAGPTAGCTPLTCTASSGDQYCGVIGDGCGNSLDCGTTCTKPGWTCQNNLCVGPPGVCTPLTCATASGDQYCGVIGDGCGNSLDCGTTCPKTGWTCQSSLCKAGPTAGCTPLTCNPATGGQYCGTIGDGCGNSVNCGTDCSAAGSGWVCGSNNSCVGGPGCLPVTCNNASGVQQYCGNVGDGCGATLGCPATCANSTPCGAITANVCEPCGGLCLNRVRCSGTATTSISGTVYDPAGYNQLYNVIVSIPNLAIATLDPITTGSVSCSTCDGQVSGQPIATALTDANGHFLLNDVPWGVDIPLVMQLGKWRRQITIPKSMVTNQCGDNPITETKPVSLLRLP
ncbi:MAG: hypothetical protein WBV96_20620, partial [Polyangia bacterium]